MYELSRVRLYSVGPKAARYQDVLLDFRDGGAPVARPAAPATLFDGPGQVLRRPSPASVLFAENGNGKSVLIKLIFSVMLPGRKQIVGTSNTKAMENFVLAEDVAHVALEWMHVETGELVVTGKASAWKDHRVSADSSRLTDGWYSFRPTPEFTLDDLPFTEQGRLVALPGFKDRLAEASAVQPHLQLVWEINQREWTKKLDDLGLDPELFAYQRQMNAGEGEAADAFAFKSDEAFTDWLLRSVLDKDGPRAMADVIDEYATRLAERAAVAAERDFVAGALDRLAPLAVAARDQDAAKIVHAEAATDATRLAGALVARHRLEDARLANLIQEQVAANEEVERTEREQRHLNRIVLELRRIVAGLRLDAARAEESALVGRRDATQTLLAAWDSVDTLLRFREVHAKADALRTQIGQQEEAAAGPLAARNAAAEQLVHGLIAAAAAADTAAAEAAAAADTLDGRADTAGAEETEHRTLAEQYRGEARRAQEKIDAAQDSVDAAVRDGLLPAGADVRSAATAAQTAATDTAASVAAADAGTIRLRDQRRTAETALTGARDRAQAARRAAEEAETAHQVAVTATAVLTAEDRFAALLGTEEVLLDTDAPALIERLHAAIDDAKGQRDLLRYEEQEDRRVLAALGDGGLLPPPVEVTAVRDLLRGGGVACYTGWEYLAQMPEDERDRALHVYPHLVDGVVLNNPDHADRARTLLDDARVLPSAAVAVGTTAALVDLTAPTPAGMLFLVPPNPALYDEYLAAAERERLETAQAERHERLAALETAIATDTDLLRRLTDWRETYPPGALTALADARDTATENAAAATAAEETTQTEVDRVNTEEDALLARLPDLRAAAQAAERVANRLATLADECANVAAWTEEVRRAKHDAALADQTAEAVHDTAKRFRKDRDEQIRRAGDHERAAATYRAEIAKTPGAGSLDTTAPAPSSDLPTLRAAYEAALAVYEQVDVGADLRANLAALERAEAEAQKAVESLPTDIRDEAARLLSGPDGGDEPARAAATARVRRALADLNTAVHEAGIRVGGLDSTYKAFQPQGVTLEPYGRPETISAGEALEARAAADFRAASETATAANDNSADVQARITSAGKDAEHFAALVETLADSAPAELDPATVAYGGTYLDARARRDAVRAALRGADGLLEEAQAAVRRTSNAVYRYAADQRFESVDSPVRRQILNVDPERLHEYGADWEEALKPRLRSLQDELAQIDRHRNQIILHLHRHVDTALRTLKAAERVSELPETLGDWAGQRFLHIRFRDPEPGTLHDRLAEVIDAAVTGDKAGKRDGMTILLRGVRAALPHGIKVEMLKPDATLRAERVRISAVADVLSGGQLLTAAIILYCTMAALRANDRGRVRQGHAGVLFLDNPIGRASAGYLLELQLGVAQALGVQLVYTTGLFDLNALSVFPLIVRLRNDRDVRSGKKYLSVDDEIRNHLAALGEPDETGRVTAARLFRRPSPDLVPTHHGNGQSTS